MKNRISKIENAGIPAMVKLGKLGLSNTPPCGAKIKNGWPAKLKFGRNWFTDRPLMTSFKFNFTLTPVIYAPPGVGSILLANLMGLELTEIYMNLTSLNIRRNARWLLRLVLRDISQNIDI